MKFINLFKTRKNKKLDEEIRQMIIEGTEIEAELLTEEMEDVQPHEFSPEFEAKMDELIKSMRKRRFFGCKR